jgi:hypothetical protein
MKTLSQQLAEQGMQQVLWSNEPFGDQVEHTIRQMMKATTRNPIDSDDIRRAHRVFGRAEPKHPNAWGAAVNKAVRKGLLIPTGAYRKTKRKAGHARALAVYRLARP